MLKINLKKSFKTHSKELFKNSKKLKQLYVLLRDRIVYVGGNCRQELECHRGKFPKLSI